MISFLQYQMTFGQLFRMLLNEITGGLSTNSYHIPCLQEIKAIAVIAKTLLMQLKNL